MKPERKKWFSFAIAFFLALSVIPNAAIATNEVTISQPKLYINSKGKVSVANENGKVESKSTIWNRLLDRYRYVVAGISAFGAVTMILFFIIGFGRLGSEFPRTPKDEAGQSWGLSLPEWLLPDLVPLL
ncbi:hypothetical protein [Caldibacillus debilis]|uniref:Uncharacterized protein n=1 Tax=Caldibacillus debilis GB1 TaxID=1339248 RepID=A0A420VDI3_9BACI|nr:hypothetical protein [Caldibacillus debilis]RKO61649.1 hypothetical protein Cdeb_01120 [Caldibacillus debilis GB1]